MQPGKVTSAKLWRRLRQEGVLVKLPSGFVARLRPVSIYDLVSEGQIPDILTPIALQTLITGGVEVQDDKAAAQRTADFVNVLVKHAFLKPRIVDEPDPESNYEIALEDVLGIDRTFIFTWLVGGQVDALRGFLDQQKTDVHAMADGKQFRPATERGSGHS